MLLLQLCYDLLNYYLGSCYADCLGRLHLIGLFVFAIVARIVFWTLLTFHLVFEGRKQALKSVALVSCVSLR